MKEHFCPAEKSIITYQDKCNWCGESEGSMNFSNQGKLAENLMKDLLEVIHKYDETMYMVSVLGVLRLVEIQLIEEHSEEDEE